MKDSNTPAAINLRAASSCEWVTSVLNNFDAFLIDHAANERKASSMALSLVAHYPDKRELTTRLIDLALEELNHFRQVVRLMQKRNLVMTPDEKDPYVNQLRSHVRRGSEGYFLDQLLCAAVIEARGEERFTTLSEALVDVAMKKFYKTLAVSEKGHHQVFIQLAQCYFPKTHVKQRLSEWIDIEGEIFAQIPIKSRVH